MGLTLYILPVVVGLILLTLLILLLARAWRAIRATLLLKHWALEVTPKTVQPRDLIRVRAHVVPRGDLPLSVRATLRCALLDHRYREIYRHTQALTAVEDEPGQWETEICVPAYALRTGAVGDTLSHLFSEDAHIYLVDWSVELEVLRGTGAHASVVAWKSVPLYIPDGIALQPTRQHMERLIAETCGAMRNDMVCNWVVRMANIDGAIAPRERAFLHQVLQVAYGIDNRDAADTRIDAELRSTLALDPWLMRRNLPAEDLQGFYRLLYAMAWRSGDIDGREHAFLIDALRQFGLDRRTAKAIEMEVLRDLAQHAIY